MFAKILVALSCLAYATLASVGHAQVSTYTQEDITELRRGLPNYVGVAVYVVRDLATTLPALAARVDWDEDYHQQDAYKELRETVSVLNLVTNFLANDEEAEVLRSLIKHSELHLFGASVIRLGERQHVAETGPAAVQLEPSALSQLSSNLNIWALTNEPVAAAQQTTQQLIASIRKVIDLRISIGFGGNPVDMQTVPQQTLTKSARYLAMLFAMALPKLSFTFDAALTSEPLELWRARRAAIDTTTAANALGLLSKGLASGVKEFNLGITIAKHLGSNPEKLAVFLGIARDVQKLEAQALQGSEPETADLDKLRRAYKEAIASCSELFEVE